MNVKNKMKYSILTVLITILVSMVGCSELKYTEDEQDMIANYAADLVLKHDVNYKDDFIETTKETTVKVADPFTEENTTTINNDLSDDPKVDKPLSIATPEQLTQVFNMNGLLVNYLDYYVTGMYPFDNSESALFVMKAVEDLKLLVIKFEISNPTGGDIAVNMMAGDRKYKGIVNDKIKVNAQLSLLLDALNTFDGTVAAGTSQEFVLVYQVKIESKEDIQSLALDIAGESGETTTVKLK